MRVQIMLDRGPYHGAIIPVSNPGPEIRLSVFERDHAVLYRRRGEIAEMLPGLHVATYDFVDCIESADSLNIKMSGVAVKLGEYDPTFLTLTKDEKRRRRHGKRPFHQEEDEEDAW